MRLGSSRLCSSPGSMLTRDDGPPRARPLREVVAGGVDGFEEDRRRSGFTGQPVDALFEIGVARREWHDRHRRLAELHERDLRLRADGVDLMDKGDERRADVEEHLVDGCRRVGQKHHVQRFGRRLDGHDLAIDPVFANQNLVSPDVLDGLPRLVFG